jgi:RNA polymerase sigma-70 factor (ECF subfamily)
MKDDDQELILLSKKGKMKAFRKLVEKYKKPAFFIALGLVGNRDDAYDISQETFIRIYTNLANYNPKHKFFSWFYAILTNLCKNHLRNSEVRRAYIKDGADSRDKKRIERKDHNPNVLAEKNQMHLRLWKEIDSLPFEFREIIVLKHFLGFSYKEISEMLDIPMGTVMSRLYHARRKLKEKLEDLLN